MIRLLIVYETYYGGSIDIRGHLFAQVSRKTYLSSKLGHSLDITIRRTNKSIGSDHDLVIVNLIVLPNVPINPV